MIKFDCFHIFVSVFLVVFSLFFFAKANAGFYSFSFISIDGKTINLSTFKGKVILIVNTASMCGFTSQYAGIQSLYDRYKSRGLIVIGAPSNDFGSQEPGSNKEIKQFCEVNYGINFPLTDKINVRKPPIHPFYKWARRQHSFQIPSWNFHKYLIAKNGKLVGSFNSRVSPTSRKIISAIEAQLNKK